MLKPHRRQRALVPLSLVLITAGIVIGMRSFNSLTFQGQVTGGPSTQYLVTTFEKIPNYAWNPTITAVSDGSWNSTATWSPAHVPTAADRVFIPAGKTITFDALNGQAYSIGLAGTLTFSRTVNTKLSVGTILEFDTGTLDIGNVANPIPSALTAEIMFRDLPLNTTNVTGVDYDPGQYGVGLLSLGKITMHGATKSDTFMRVAVEPLAGATTITLENPVTGWQAGDRIIVPDTRQLNSAQTSQTIQWEERTIAGISTDGKTVTLSSALTYDHKGAKNINNVIEFLPHIENLTRNVIIRSENPAGTRGHTMFTHRADVDIRYTEFKDLGRTKFTPLNNISYDTNGNAIPGTNQIGRYPIHLHHVYGPTVTPANGRQFMLLGNAVDQGTAAHSFKWAIAVHDSHFGLIKDNTVYNVMGAGIVTEDGSETGNLFDHNIIVRIGGSGGRGDERGLSDLGHGSQAFWFRGTNNDIRNNVVANSYCPGPDGCYGFDFFPYFLGNVKIPNGPGSDTTIAGQYTVKAGHALPVLNFDNNEVYASQSGLTYWWVCSYDTTPTPGCTTTYKNLHVWNLNNNGIFHYPSSNITIDGMIAINDPARLGNSAGRNIGFFGSDYSAPGTLIINSRFENLALGVYPSTEPGNGVQTVRDSTIAAVTGISVATEWTSSYTTQVLHPPRQIVIDNVKFLTPTNTSKSTHISLAYSTSQFVSDPTFLDSVKVYKYNQVAGQDFQVFYSQQHPDFDVPTISYNTDGTTMRGGCPSLTPMTNSQCMSAYGVAVGGVLATGLESIPTINGLVGPLPGSPALNLPSQAPVLFTNSDTAGNYPGFAITSNGNGTFNANMTVWTNTAATVTASPLTGTAFSPVTETTQTAGRHMLVIPNIAAGKNIDVKVTAKDQQNLTSTINLSFATPAITGDTQAPIISYNNWTVGGTRGSMATVNWTTNELTTGVVEYWLQSNPSQVLTAQSNMFQRSLSIPLAIIANESYGYRIKAKDAAGNQSVSADLSLAQCSNTVDDNDSEDGAVDSQDSGCHSDGNANNPATYVPSHNFEKNNTGWSSSSTSVTVFSSSALSSSSSSVTASSSSSSSRSSSSSVAAGSSSSFSSSSSSMHPAAPGAPPILYWNFDETNGTLAREMMLNANGTTVNNPVWTAGKIGNALNFTGTNTYASVPAALFPDLGNTFSISFWVKLSSVSTTQTLFGFNNSTNAGGVEVAFLSNGGMALMTRSMSVGQTNPSAITANAWHHIVVTKYSTAVGATKIYIDGVAQTLATNAAYNFVSNANAKMIGIRTQAGLDNHFTGLLDETCVYDREITASEVAHLYNNGMGRVCHASNIAPTVNAGQDKTISLSAGVLLAGSVTDDGLPNPPGTISKTWSKLSGPGNVTFANAGNAQTNTTFSAVGTYTLRLTASDGALTATDDVIITVTPPVNVAPVVTAGQNQIIFLPSVATLMGTVTDDGLPTGSTVTTKWSKVTGPDGGIVTFGNIHSPQTTATFSKTGVYQLLLSATDGALTKHSKVDIEVKPFDSQIDQNALAGINAGYDQGIDFIDGEMQTWTMINGFLNTGDQITIARVRANIFNDIRLALGYSNTNALYIRNYDFKQNDTIDQTDLALWNTYADPCAVLDPETAMLITKKLSNEFELHFNTSPGNSGFNSNYDFNGNGTVDESDRNAFNLFVARSCTNNSQGRVEWSLLSGPTDILFENRNAMSTKVFFWKPGRYVLRLRLSEGSAATFDDVMITVVEPIALGKSSCQHGFFAWLFCLDLTAWLR